MDRQSGPGGLRSPGPQPGPGWYKPTRSTGPMATHGRHPAIDLPRNANNGAGVTSKRVQPPGPASYPGPRWTVTVWLGEVDAPLVSST
jgi:hypothetical protein